MTMRLGCAVVCVVLASSGGAFAQAPQWRVERLSPQVRAEFQTRFQELRLGPEQTEKYTRTIKAGRGATLDLQNISGSITVTGVGGDEIVIEALKRVRARDVARAKTVMQGIEIRLIDRPGRVTVRTIYPRMSGAVSAAVDYTVRVPQDAAVDLTSMSGDLRASNVKGELRLETVNGSVHAGQAPRLGYARSVSGNVEITGPIDGELSASSLTGALFLKGVRARALELTTISGDVVLDDVLVDRARLRSVNGDMRFIGVLSKNGHYDMTSHSGRIQMMLPSTAGFEVDAATFSGNVRSALPLTIVSTRERSETEPSASRNPRVARMSRSQTLRGTAGDAGAYLVIRTFSGDIVLDTNDKRGKKP